MGKSQGFRRFSPKLTSSLFPPPEGGRSQANQLKLQWYLRQLQDLSSVLDDGTLLAELDDITKNLNISLVKSEMRDKAGVDAATLAKNWGIGIEAAKRTRLMTTQRGIRIMIHPSFTKRYKTNDRQLRYRRLPVTMYTDIMFSTILSRQDNKADQIFCTDFGFVREFPMKK
jgi:hypothetical protein